MVFADLIFIYIFLPLNLILYYATDVKSVRNAVLILFSLFFYAWGEPVWIILLIFSASIDYIHGLIVYHNKGKLKAKLAVASSLVLNLGLLAVFKYGAFFTSSINSLTGLSLPVMEFGLPIGISFYTFQTISYVIDVYKGEVEAQRSYFKFLMFVSLYHQLVAGPIVRYSHIAHEIDHRVTDSRDISSGVTRFILGLFKKVCVANIAGELSSVYLDGDISSLSVFGSWYALMLFSLQIYYDFSGYSDMAIGLGKMFGFHYYENFNYPYIAKNAGDFWRRWHISLGSFFRDYLYIPLGGNRRRWILNLFIVWFATGLWHGAGVNFILWGLFWGAFILIERLFLSKVLSALPSLFSHIYLLVVLLFSWVIFYYTDIGIIAEYMSIMCFLTEAPLIDIGTELDFFANIFWFIAAVLFCTPIVKKFKDFVANDLSEKKQSILFYFGTVLNACLLLLCTAYLVGESYNPFLYFRF